MKQGATATIPMEEYLNLKNFYEEISKNKIAFYNGYTVRNCYTASYDSTTTEFLTTEEVVLKIQKYNTKLQEEIDFLSGEAEKLRRELRRIKELPKYEKIDPIIENTKENFFTRLFKKISK